MKVPLRPTPALRAQAARVRHRLMPQPMGSPPAARNGSQMLHPGALVPAQCGAEEPFRLPWVGADHLQLPHPLGLWGRVQANLQSPKQEALYRPVSRALLSLLVCARAGHLSPCHLPSSPPAIPQRRATPAVHEGRSCVLGALDVLPDQLSEGHNGSRGLRDPVVRPRCVVQVGHMPLCPETLLPGGCW